MNTRKIGEVGEGIAEDFLKKKGYRVLHRNWFCYAGELDLVAESPERVLTFVEVKFLRGTGFCRPHELLTSQKRRVLLRTRRNYLSKNPSSQKQWRLDFVGITRTSGGMEIKHYEGV